VAESLPEARELLESFVNLTGKAAGRPVSEALGGATGR
jgi:hypothetical protein